MTENKEDYTESFFGFVDTATNWINPIPFFESDIFRQGFCLTTIIILLFCCFFSIKEDDYEEQAGWFLVIFAVISSLYAVYNMILWAYC